MNPFDKKETVTEADPDLKEQHREFVETQSRLVEDRNFWENCVYQSSQRR